MNEGLEKVRHRIKVDPKLADLEVRAEGSELHLARGDRGFARIFPTEKTGVWRMEYFQNRDRWESLDFKGTLDECLDLLVEKSHYLFWEG